MHSKTKFAFSSAAILCLVACGDDISKTTEVEAAGVPVVAAGEKIPVCESAAQGNMVYVEDSLAVYYCSGKEWLPVKGENGSSGEDGESCSVKATVAGYDVYCGDKKVGELSNGAAGVPGSSGSKGDDGASCTLSETENGYDVLCGGKKVGELSNGSDGAPGSAGSKGDEGASCTVKETSTGYDVLCGDKKVGELTNGSNGAPGSAGSKGDEGASCTVKETSTGYDVLCGDKKVGELTNGSDGAPGSAGSKGDEGASCTVKETSTGYDVLCGGKKVGELSNGSDGAPGSSGSKGDDCTLTDNGDGTITQKCGEEEVTLYKALCGTAPYDPAGDKFCYGVTLYDKCGGKAYDVNAEECVDSEVVTK